jgi:hypothetical protein
MHILLVADGRSPITARWIDGLLALQYKVTLISTFPCKAIEGVADLHVIPVAYGGMGSAQSGSDQRQEKKLGIRSKVPAFRSLFLFGRYLLGPMTLPSYGQLFRDIVQSIQPDLVHALRIPFEGMLASFTPSEIPYAVSIWGNDLTYHALGSKQMAFFTRRTLERAAGLAADTRRDIHMAHQWGFPSGQPELLIPGNGGIDRGWMDKSLGGSFDWPEGAIPQNVPLVINPRGFRPGSVRSDVFFHAIPLILQRKPEVAFLCAAMAKQPEASAWVRRLKIGRNIRLLPYMPQARLWDLFRRSTISISVSIHDGTPNSLLEAMALGCFPVAGDIQSLREWIVPGVNGLLVEPTKPQSLAEAVLLALDDPDLRKNAAGYNERLIQERASIEVMQLQLDTFYQRLLQKTDA